jgi:two-component system sensor kinase FixL
MKSAILSSLHSGVAVLDHVGRIIDVNQAWAWIVTDSTSPSQPAAGTNYLDTWRAAAGRGEPRAVELLVGIEAVLCGDRPGFAFEYPSAIPGAERWIALSVVSLGRPEGGAVVSCTDVTERKRAEIEAQRSRQELAHFTRVSTMGELTASIAHELNQPLTGILANAQAARRFLDQAPPPLDEVREILADIVDDDKRAAEVIQRLRELLRKGHAEMQILDLNDLIQDVVRLLSSDAVIRDVKITLDPEVPSAVIEGDRVQLQQVILNLLLNAMEAMAETDKDLRTLVVRIRPKDGRAIHVSVEDTGPGLRPGTHELVFEPFYSTKVSGMGMGLAIARSIVDSHGGAIWAENNRIRGVTFHFSLPLAGRSA